MVANRGEQVGHVVVIQRVEVMATLRTNPDEPQRAQEPQMMRRGALAETRRGGKVLDRSLARQHLDEQSQTPGGAERTHRLGNLASLELLERPAHGVVLGRVWHSTTVTTSEQVFIRPSVRSSSGPKDVSLTVGSRAGRA